MNRKRISIGISAAILAIALFAVVGLSRRGESQAAPTKLVIGIYAPTVEFGTAQARVSYVQGLAKAIEGNLTNVKVDAQSFASLAQLRKADVDFAIVDAQCYAANLGWKLLANAQIGGSTSRQWALYSSIGPSMPALRGEKLAFVQTGCNDAGFVDNAMLESEVSNFFSGRVGKPDLAAAVAEVASYKGAQAVFAPVGSGKGLTKVSESPGSVPNPAFVQLNTKLAGGIDDKVKDAVVSYGGGGAISGWSDASKGAYSSLSNRMGRVVKRAVAAPPMTVRGPDSKDLIIEPPTLDDTAQTDVKQHFEKPPVRLD